MVSLKHKHTSLKADGPDATLIKPTDWNDEHEMIVSGANRYLGRNQSASGPVQELGVVPKDATDDGTLWTKAAIEAAIAAAVAPLLVAKINPPTYDTYALQAALALQIADPMLNSIPQITEGNLMFTRAYTALNAAHRIRVTCTGFMTANITANGLVALFIDGAAPAVRSTYLAEAPNANVPKPFTLKWEGALAAGEHIFTVRAGFFGASLFPNSFGNAGAAGVGGGTTAWVLTVEELLTP